MVFSGRHPLSKDKPTGWIQIVPKLLSAADAVNESVQAWMGASEMFETPGARLHMWRAAVD